ncbi:hypothetical protein HPDFL43_16751 [Hoeflea phototrophica DFL-43]|uniref:Uncharacterized protein n=2 Tax=Hoeflea TaxID=274591 RepID=A9D7U6_HOEPD|nr:hypothetical protein HPDFL43_16751 [Hoeflea phototrophica DFL-43]
MKHFSSSRLKLPYHQMLALRGQGKLELAVSRSAASQVTLNGVVPNKSVSAAFHFYTILGYLLLAVGLYFAFTRAWWWGPLGFFVALIVWQANRKGTSESVLDTAIEDEAFYDRLRDAGALMYQVDDDTAILLETAYGIEGH